MSLKNHLRATVYGSALLCSLGGVGMAAAGPAPDSDEARIKDRNLKEVYLRGVELKDAAVLQGRELQALRTAYESDPDPSRFAARRERVRAELAATLGSLEDVRKKYQVLGGAIIYTRALGAVAGKPDAPPPTERDYDDMSRFNRFDKEMRWIHRGWEGVLEDEAPAFAAARRRAEAGRSGRARRWAWGAAGSVMLLAAAAYGLRRLGRVSPPPTSEAPLAFETTRAVGRAEGWAFGSQWAAEREGKPAVVRRLAPEFSNVGREADRMAALIRAATAFRHPRIEEVREVGVSADGVFLVVEPSVGRPLADVLGAGKPLGLTAALAVMAPVAQALDAAHAAGFAHGSLTPERILLLPDGSGRVTDFGLARALATREAARARVFSPAYAAPEVLEGKIRLASDLYAFGVILFETLFVRLPFDGPNLTAMKQERRFPAPSALLGRPAPRVDAFFAGAFEPTARRRRPPAGGLAAALDAFSEMAG